MLKFISWCLKIVPSVWYIYELNIFVRDTVADITPFWKSVFAYGIPSAVVLGFLLYFTLFRDLLIRQKAQEQFENEEKKWTVGVQTKRLFRVYMPLAFIGILLAMMFYLYKPYIILLSIKIGILYAWFILGEVIRIISIGKKNNQEIVKKLNKDKTKKEPTD